MTARMLSPTSGAPNGTTSTRAAITDWRTRAACRDQDAEAWFPDGVVGYALAGDAFDTCDACPVRVDCLDWALQFEGSLPVNCRAGIYAGTTPTERHRLYLERVAARNAA